MTATLEVCVDLGDPVSFLAFEPTRMLAVECDVALDWLPLAAKVRAGAPPPAPVEGAAESVGERHRRVRQTYRRMDLERYAAWRGLSLELPDRSHRVE